MVFSPDLRAWQYGVLDVQYSFLPHEWRAAYNESPFAVQTIPRSALQHFAFQCRQWETRFDVLRSYESCQQVMTSNRT